MLTPERKAELQALARAKLDAGRSGQGQWPSSPTDPALGSPPLPEKFTEFRDHQTHAIADVMEQFERGVKVVFLDAPTGAGKTLIGEAVRRLVGGRGLYVPTTKHLQDQFLRDFPYAAVLKGRANYAIESAWLQENLWGDIDHNERLTAADCTSAGIENPCRLCSPMSSCPYNIAKADAIRSPLAVLNTAYALTDFRYHQAFSGRDLVICDEGDLLETQLMGVVELRMSKRFQRKYDVPRPKRKTVEDAWIDWVADKAIPIVTQAVSKLPPPNEAGTTIAAARERKQLVEMLGSLQHLHEELEQDSNAWVHDQPDDGSLVWKPIHVAPWGHDVLWSHGQRFLVMSGTLLSADLRAASLGLNEPYAMVSMPSPYAEENRPVRYIPVANMAKKYEKESLPKMADAICKVVDAHPDDRILIHCVSYGRADRIRDTLRKHVDGDRPVIIYQESAGKNAALDAYLKAERAILVAPSMDRGVDLPGDACRVQIIAKIPYPNMGDKQVAARAHSRGGDLWYAVETIATLMQMTGRGVRSEDDHCVTYVLDEALSARPSSNPSLWGKIKKLAPQWWIDGFVFNYPRGEIGL